MLSHNTPLITWKQLKKYHLGDSVIFMYRSENDQKKYDAVKNKNIFALKVMKRLFDSDKKVIITINKYPYNVSSDIIHCVIWLNPVYYIGIDDILNILHNEYKLKPNQYILFNINNVSITSIEHCQLFVKKITYNKLIHNNMIVNL